MAIVTLITKLAQLEEFYNKAQESKYLAYDCETTGLQRYAEVVGVSFAISKDEGFYIPIKIWKDKQLIRPWSDEAYKIVLDCLQALLLHSKRLITHNGSFDAKVTYNTFKIDILDNIFSDTQLLHHTCIDEGESHALKYLAAKYISPDAQNPQLDLKQSVLRNGGSWVKDSKEMYKGDWKILGNYAAYDTIYTYSLFDLWQGEIEKQGLQNLWYNEVLPLLKVTYELNTTGLKVDLKYFEKLKIDMTARIEALEDEIYASIKEHVQDYEARKVQENLTITKRSEIGKILISKGLDPEKPLDSSGLAIVYEWYKQKKKVRSIFNLDSGDDKAFLVYDILGIPCTEFTASGKRSTAKALIDKLAEENADKSIVLKLLLERSKELKLLNTYVDAVLERNENGRIYPNFMQTGTTSGRYSCGGSSLNLQTLPRSDTRIKSGFIPDEGYSFVAADYSSLEPRCLLKDSKVLIADIGYSTLEDVNENTLIKTSKGFYKIVKKWNTTKKVFHVVTNEGVISGSEDHKVYADNKWKTIKDLTLDSKLESIKESIVVEKDIRLPLYSEISLRDGKRKSLGLLKLDEELAWVIGAFLGDGSARLTHRNKDKNYKSFGNTLNIECYVQLVGLLEDGVTTKFKNVLEKYGFRNSSWFDKRSNNLQTVHFPGREITNLFASTFNVINNLKEQTTVVKGHVKSKKFRIPSYIFNAKKSIKLAFIAGLIDTDGSVTSHNGDYTREVHISTHNAEFAGDIIQLYKQLGLTARLRISHKKQNNTLHRCYQISITQEAAYKLAKSNISLFLACKRKWNKLKDRLLIKPIKGVLKPLKIYEIYENGYADMVDISVDQVQEFEADGFRVHNSFAEVSGEPKIQKIFKEGLDFYSSIAIDVLGLKGVSARPEDPNYLGTVDKEKRQFIKAIALAIPYGAQAGRLSQLMKLSYEEADEIYHKYIDAYPVLKEWMDRCNYDMKTKGFTASRMGRKKRGPVVHELYTKYKVREFDKKGLAKVFNRLPKYENISDATQLYLECRNSLNVAKNHGIQSMAASICNVAMIELKQALIINNLDAKIAVTVHDEVILLVKTEQAQVAAKLLQHHMENNAITNTMSVKMIAEPVITQQSLAEAK